MDVVRHSPGSCPGPAGNDAVHPCLRAMDERIAARSIGVVGRWADPPAHGTDLVLDAASAHPLQEVLLESGLFAYAA